MCRNIKRLHNLEPAARVDEVRDAALQFVRKISSQKRSATNAEAFDRAVDEIAEASRRLLHSLVAHAPPRTREDLAARARERFERRSA